MSNPALPDLRASTLLRRYSDPRMMGKAHHAGIVGAGGGILNPGSRVCSCRLFRSAAARSMSDPTLPDLRASTLLHRYSDPRMMGFAHHAGIVGAGGGIRTRDLLITNQLLYRLSHTSKMQSPFSVLSYYITQAGILQYVF